MAVEPSKLKINIEPTSIPADNNIYECIFVQLQDSSSRPARALEDTAISLSSSLTSIGAVDPTITITKGNTYAVAKFHSTFTPGTTAIAATELKTDYTTSAATTQVVVVSSASTGSVMQLCVKDDTGNPVEGALIISMTQPTGMKSISGTTNQTGYAAFPNALEGSYTLKILKEGYLPTNQTINFTSQKSTSTLFISKSAANTSGSNPFIIPIIVAIVAVVAVILAILMLRRRKSGRFKVPPKAQKQSSSPTIGPIRP